MNNIGLYDVKGGFFVKIVYSSTSEQEQEIGKLVSYFYSSIFPKYFHFDEILHFQEIGVLQVEKNCFTYCGTLKEAYQVMTCLQVIQFILEKKEKQSPFPLDKQSAALFMRNISLLNDTGIFFPFFLDNFTSLKCKENEIALTMNCEPANQYLI